MLQADSSHDGWNTYSRYDVFDIETPPKKQTKIQGYRDCKARDL